jgi:hypothetical protein
MNDTYIGVATRFVQNRTLAILSRASSLEAVLKEGFERKSPRARLWSRRARAGPPAPTPEPPAPEAEKSPDLVATWTEVAIPDRER